MKLVEIRYLVLLVLPILSFPSFAEKHAEYGDIIVNTQEYKKITTEKNDDRDDRINRNSRNNRHKHYGHYPYHQRSYPDSSVRYNRSAGSGPVGLSGHVYFGIAIGKSEFDYEDVDDGDASIFHIGYRPRDSRLGYELSFYNSGDSQVTSLTNIKLQVDTVNLVIKVNSSIKKRSPLNLFAQSGIYFANATLSGPFDSVSEKSNGFLLAAGVEIMLNQQFSLTAEAYNLFDVGDFANDESISFFSLGGQFVF